MRSSVRNMAALAAGAVVCAWILSWTVSAFFRRSPADQPPPRGAETEAPRNVEGVPGFDGGAIAAGERTAVRFRVPEYDEEGRLRSLIIGDQACASSNGDIEVTNMRLEFYKEGRLDVCITSPRCVYNRASNTVFSDSRVQIESGVVTISGIGLKWDRTKDWAMIEDQARVEFKNMKGFFQKESEACQVAH